MIDALDEEVEILFQIFQDDVPLFPPTVRLFVTSRDAGYLRSLMQDSHFYLLNLDIREESDLNDLNNIQTFLHHALRKIARMEGYPFNWPGIELEEELTMKAMGLFVWIATMMRFLPMILHPRSSELCCLAHSPALHPKRK